MKVFISKAIYLTMANELTNFRLVDNKDHTVGRIDDHMAFAFEMAELPDQGWQQCLVVRFIVTEPSDSAVARASFREDANAFTFEVGEVEVDEDAAISVPLFVIW